MNRRHLVLGLLICTTSASALLADDDTLPTAYEALSPAARMEAQSKLQIGGFYDGAQDGAFGPRTRAALVDAATFVADKSYGRVVHDLSTVSGAKAFVTDLSRGELDGYLWGEGDESDGG